MKYQPLTAEKVRKVIEGKADPATRVPTLIHFWVHPEEFGDRQQNVIELLNSFPEDVQRMRINSPTMFNAPDDDPGYKWMNIEDPFAANTVAMDAMAVLSDYSLLDEVLADRPDPNYPGMFPDNPEPDGRYRLATWWNVLFEKHWQFRGMTEALMDFYSNGEGVHKLYSALTDFYIAMMERAKKELKLDGIFSSDDIGMQNTPFFRTDIFREFFKPYYKKLIDKAHELDMHFWLHTCGNIEPFMQDFIEIGLDVIHPIQKYTMDEKTIAQKYGSKICIWGGFDVQQTIPWGTVEEVKKEVRFMFDTYRRAEGRFVFGAGNGINGDCPLNSLKALFEEAFEYGRRELKPA